MTDYDVAIIGAGMAGLTAALNIRRLGKSVIVFEHETFGGQITHSPLVENFPCVESISGNALMMTLFSQAEKLGANFELDRVTEIHSEGKFKRVFTESGNYLCKAVIIATGAKPRVLGLDREEEFVGEGVSYCSLCDGAFYKDKTVAVVGGGNSAIGEAINLASIARKVYIIHRGKNFRGEKVKADTLSSLSNVEAIMETRVVELLGDKSLTGVKLATPQGERQLALDALFISVGHTPCNENFASSVRLDQNGYIIASEDCITSCSGIFAAGDCRTKQIRQLTTAAADGSVAAEGACVYIDNM